jgi:pimeloyl-ACP methyl ester carboxylesterase
MQQLSYEVTGTGPPLVVLHGTSSTPVGTWGPVIGELARSFKVIHPYLPGSGESSLPEGPIDSDVVAEQIVDVAARAGHDRFALAGASLGSPIAIATAARYPEKVSRLVSVAGYASARSSLRLRLDLWASLLDSGAEINGRLLLILGLTDQFAAVLPEDVLDAMIKGIGSALEPGTPQQLDLARTIDVEEALSRLTVPTLLIHGRQDNFVDPAHSVHLAKRIPGAVLLEFEAGHGVTSEATEAGVAAMTEFLLG